MVREFKLPDVGEGVAEGELVSWLVEEGDPISEDQPVAEVETDKALVEVPAPVDGSVRELRAEEGEIVPVGDVIITFDLEGEESAETAPDAEPDDSTTETAAATEPETDSASRPASGDEPAGDPGATGGDIEDVATPEGRVFAPPRVRRMAREEGVDLESIQGSGPGGRITDGDVQSAASDVQAAAGERSDSDAPDGSSTVSPDKSASSADSETESTASDSSGVVDSAERPTQSREQLESADRERTLAAPATRRLAEEEGIDIDTVPTDETRDGEPFVTPEAVTEYATMQREAQEADAAAVSSSESTAVSSDDPADRFEGEREHREPFKGVRKAIADAMVESKYSAPHVTHHDEVDVTELVELRERLKPRAAEEGITLTYMPFITKAVVAALAEFPEMNAVIDEDNEEIVYRNYYNIGVATATDVGLMVPVVDDADEKGLLQIASETNELVQKARERSISPEELQGSTFTITNVGGIGGEYATPILNYPETGILAVGEIKRKPRVVTDEDGTESIEPRSVMTLSLSFDHRLIDGAAGARFTNALMEYLEDPQLLLLK